MWSMTEIAQTKKIMLPCETKKIMLPCEDAVFVKKKITGYSNVTHVKDSLVS